MLNFNSEVFKFGAENIVKHATFFDNEVTRCVQGQFLTLNVFHVVLEHITSNTMQLPSFGHDTRLGIWVELCQILLEGHCLWLIVDHKGEVVSFASHLLDLDHLLRQKLVLIGVGNESAVGLLLLLKLVAVCSKKSLFQNANVGLISQPFHSEFQDHELEELVEVFDVGLGGLSNHLVVLINSQNYKLNLLLKFALQLIYMN